ncbi:MAG: lipoprotein [Methyloprofundus sp.]|nr:lipoprotein [Methyloprofundus sp.]
MIFPKFLALLICGLLLNACGQTGPLVMPLETEIQETH